MAGPSEVLREYLLALGFKIDKKEAKDFDNKIVDIDKTARRAGGALVGLAGAAATMAQVYANAMEKLYYASRHTGSTVAEMQAIGYAGKQVGVDVTKGIEAVTTALRNPGLRGFMSQLLGRSVTGSESPAKLFPELVKALKASSSEKNQREAYAKLLGFGPEYFDYEKVIDELEEKTAESAQIAKKLGINLEETADASHAWNQTMRRIALNFDMAQGAIIKNLIPWSKDLEQFLTEWMREAVDDANKSTGFFDFMRRSLISMYKDDAAVWSEIGKDVFGKPQDAEPGGFKEWLLSFSNSGKGIGGTTAQTAKPQGGTPKYTKQQLDDAISNYSDIYGVPEKYVRAIMKVESNDGKNLVSPTGVKGLTQIDAKNAKRLGITDRFDDMQALEGTFKMMQENYKSTGSWDKAVWMYGNGSAPLGAAGPGGDPRYLDKIHAAIHQTNNITVNGGDAGKITQAVGDAMDKSNGDLLRNAKGSIQ